MFLAVLERQPEKRAPRGCIQEANALARGRKVGQKAKAVRTRPDMSRQPAKIRWIPETKLSHCPMDYLAAGQCWKGAQVQPGRTERKGQPGRLSFQVDMVHDNLRAKRRAENAACLPVAHCADTDSCRGDVIRRHDNWQPGRQTQFGRCRRMQFAHALVMGEHTWQQPFGPFQAIELKEFGGIASFAYIEKWHGCI